MTQTKKFDGKVYKLHELHTSKKEANECAKQLREDLALHARITKGETMLTVMVTMCG